MAVDAVTPVPAPAGSTGTAPTPAPDAVASNGMTEELQKVLEADGTLLGEHAYSHLRMKSLFIFFGCCFLGANLAVLLWAVPACRRKVDEYTQCCLSFVKNLKMTAAIVLVLLVVFVVIEHWRLSSTSSRFGEFSGKIVNSYVGQLSAKTMVEAPNLHDSPASPWSQKVKNPFTYGVSITTMDIKVYAENEKFGDTTLQSSVAIGPEEEKQFDTHLTLTDGPSAGHELSKILAGGVTGEGVGALSFDIDMAGSVSGSDFTATMNIDVPFKANGSPVAGNAVAVCDSMVKGIQLLHDKELTLMDYNRLVTSGALAVHTKLMTFMYCIILIPLSTWFAVSAWASQGEKGASAEGPATTSAPTDATLATPAPAAADASSAPPATGDKDSDNEF
jgi:LEA14-like dessication related protein